MGEKWKNPCQYMINYPLNEVIYLQKLDLNFGGLPSQISMSDCGEQVYSFIVLGLLSFNLLFLTRIVVILLMCPHFSCEI